ncbi:MAG: hypothetical protein ACH346_04055 [Chthoniobacterales bacterium]
MFQLTLTWFIFIYLAVFLAGILILWIGYEMLRKHLSSTVSHHTIYCRICGTKVINDNNSSFLTCLTCGSLNERNNQGGL